jgi:Tfp pilus assembly protein PilN
MSQQINLYEERLRPRHELLTARNLVVLALIVLAVAVGLAIWAKERADQKSGEAGRLQAQLSEQEEQLAVLAKAVSEQRVSLALVTELNDARDVLATRTAVVEQLESGQQGNATGFSEIFAGFARQALASSKLWLTGFSVARGGETIDIYGRTHDASVLPAYVQRLRSEPAFAGRRFSGLEMLDRDIKSESAASGKAGSRENLAAPPRFVEFTLRAEGAVDGPKAAGASEGRRR